MQVDLSIQSPSESATHHAHSTHTLILNSIFRSVAEQLTLSGSLFEKRPGGDHTMAAPQATLSTSSSRPPPESSTPKPCCLRCAQLYKAYPDLQCDPGYEDNRKDKGITRREATGCKNCRTRKLRCQRVPDRLQPALSRLQESAQDMLAAQSFPNMGALVAAFYQLRTAQEQFSKECLGQPR